MINERVADPLTDPTVRAYSRSQHILKYTGYFNQEHALSGLKQPVYAVRNKLVELLRSLEGRHLEVVPNLFELARRDSEIIITRSRMTGTYLCYTSSEVQSPRRIEETLTLSIPKLHGREISPSIFSADLAYISHQFRDIIGD
jgi:hypothetical protein